MAGRGRTRAYVRPTLTAAGSFENVTGMAASGPRDTLVKYQLL